MQLQPSDLEANGYVKTDALRHNDLVPFIQKYLKSNNTYTLFYKVFHFTLFALLASLIGYSIAKNQITISKAFSQFSFGIVLSFLLLPIHELLHGWAYKKVGASKVSYAAEWKKLYFMAIADQFVANRKEFVFVAILPFATISSFGLLISPFLSWPLMITSLSTVLIHGSMCGGDFGLLSYFKEKSHLDVVTYDDVPNKISYFYEKAS